MEKICEYASAKSLSDYHLPDAAYEDIENYLDARKKYQSFQSRENKQAMFFYYEMAYTSIKHCVVNGVIPREEMWRLVDILCEY